MKIREDTENNILDINIGKLEILDYQIGMIRMNKDLNILEFNNVRENAETILSFDLDGKKKLGEYISSKSFSKEEGLKLILNIIEKILKANEYLLSENNFLIDINYMYYDLETLDFKIIYVPIFNSVSIDINEDFKSLVKVLIVDLIDFKEEYQYDGFIGVLLKFIRGNVKISELKTKIESMIYGNTILKKEISLSKEEVGYFDKHIYEEENLTKTSKEKKSFDSEELYGFIEEKNERIKHPICIKVCISILQVIVFAIIIFLVLQGLEINVLALISLIFILIDMIIVRFLLQHKGEEFDLIINGEEDEFNEKGFINIGKKEIISQNVYESDALEKREPYFLLINDEITERVYITKNNFIIGRLGSECDYVINNNTVGKKHLKVVKENNEFYIEDLYSKNGTYINEKRVKSGQLYKVKENFKIKISNVELIYKEI
ncbi:MAG: DUF6382 domain-containing protein [Sarcina sp.]